MDVECVQTPPQFIIDRRDDEMAAAAVQIRQISGSELRPVARLDAPREYGVEQEGPRGREREAALGAATRRSAALHPGGDPIEIVAAAPEALRAEIIRRAVHSQGIELGVQLFPRPRNIAQADAEAVADQRTDLELACIGVNV